MKPVCKAEGLWMYWRNEKPLNKPESESMRSCKRLMRVARRRFAKQEIYKEIKDNEIY